MVIVPGFVWPPSLTDSECPRVCRWPPWAWESKVAGRMRYEFTRQDIVRGMATDICGAHSSCGEEERDGQDQLG